MRVARLFCGIMLSLVLCLPATARAAFTETLPRGTFLLDLAYNHSYLSNNWDDRGNLAPLIESIDRYEPGGGKQGRLIPNADVEYSVLLIQLQYGILDSLSLAVGVPVVLNTTVNPSFAWEPGDYQPILGRPYSGTDFWEWAGSMGQPQPSRWDGNRGVLSDIVLGFRFRFTDWIEAFERVDLAMAVSVMGAIPIGRQGDPDEPVAVGTTLWDLQTQGDLAFHLSIDKMFTRELDGRLVLGLDVYYEVFFPRTQRTPTGRTHPLLMDQAPYVGRTHTLNPGDYFGFAVAADVVAVRGPTRATWLTGGSLQRAMTLPPLLTISLGYRFNANNQSRFSSRSDLWDHDQERQWQAGYRNTLSATALFSFLRLGAPLQLYVGYRTMELIPGKNVRAGQVIVAGLRAPFAFSL